MVCLPSLGGEHHVAAHKRRVGHAIRVRHTRDAHGLEHARTAQLQGRLAHLEDGGLVGRVRLDAAHVVHVGLVDGAHQRGE